MTLITAVIRRDLAGIGQQRSRLLLTPAFFILVLSLFPLGMGPEIESLRRAAPGLLTIAALLAGLLSLERLFHDDHKDGTLDSLLATGQSPALYAFGKLAAHWLSQSLPLLIASPVMVLALGLPAEEVLATGAILLPVTMLLTLIGGVGAALTEGARGGSVLLALLILPLYSPVLIFGAGALQAALTGLDNDMPVLMLWALLALAGPLAPLATGAIIRELG